MASRAAATACVSYINTAGVTESAFLARKFWIISQQREVWLILNLEIYMSASPEDPFTSIANANSSVRLLSQDSRRPFFMTRHSTHHRCGACQSGRRIRPTPLNCCPRPFSRACTFTPFVAFRVGSQPLLEPGYVVSASILQGINLFGSAGPMLYVYVCVASTPLALSLIHI